MFKRVILKKIRLIVNFPISDLDRAVRALSTQTTAKYVLDRMPLVPAVNSRFKVHDFAFSEIEIDNGLILEFGVFRGRTINYLAKKTKKTVIGFDSFEGLPESWRKNFLKGTFALETLPKVQDNVKLIKGWFDKSIPEFLKTSTHFPQIAYLHIDCDLYGSTKVIFEYLRESIVSGTVIVFDEYFNYPGWESGEFAAFKEFISSSGLTYSYLTYNELGEQVAVRIN